MKASSPPPVLPETRRDPESGYTLHGKWFADPYAWLERLDSEETRAWVAAQEAVTRAVLGTVPGREALRELVARSARHARLSPPIRTGPDGREFLWPYHNVRADRRYPVMTFVSAQNDRIAPPSDPLKMVARLQAEGLQGEPYFLLPLRASGHAGGTTQTALIEQDVDELSFLCWALDVSPSGEDGGPARGHGSPSSSS